MSAFARIGAALSSMLSGLRLKRPSAGQTARVVPFETASKSLVDDPTVDTTIEYSKRAGAGTPVAGIQIPWAPRLGSQEWCSSPVSVKGPAPVLAGLGLAHVDLAHAGAGSLDDLPGLSDGSDTTFSLPEGDGTVSEDNLPWLDYTLEKIEHQQTMEMLWALQELAPAPIHPGIVQVLRGDS